MSLNVSRGGKRLLNVLLPLGLAATGGLLYWHQRVFPGRPFVKFKGLTLTSPDGFQNPAFLRIPQMEPGERRPAVLMIHGGRGDNLFSTRNMVCHWTATELVKAGYVVMSCDYRRYAFAGLEVDDVVTAFEYLQSLSFVDPDRIAYYGSSHGAYIGLMASLRTNPKTIVSNWAPTDLPGMMAYLGENRMARLDVIVRETEASIRKLLEGNGQSIEAGLLGLSPIFHAAKIPCSVLIVHGTRDLIVPVAQAYALRKAMVEAGREVEMKIYSGCNHGFTFQGNARAREAGRHIMDYLHRIMEVTVETAEASEVA